MKEPVMTRYGQCYEKSAILEWVQKKGTCPLTKKPLTVNDIFPAYSLKNAIEEYRRKHKLD